MQNIIGICGFIGSGKGTVGDILCEQHGFFPESFAKPLKDAVAIIFGWDRELLEGITKESREFRERKDEFWSEKLGYEVTPRLILQKFGTESVRNILGDTVWLDSLEKRLSPYCQYVITDVRFKNEIELIKSLGGFVINVERNPHPEWFMYLPDLSNHNKSKWMEENYPDIHRSEWDWVGEKCDYLLDNNGTLGDLEKNISDMLEYFYLENAIKTGMVKGLS